jgi:hypothetical protein
VFCLRCKGDIPGLSGEAIRTALRISRREFQKTFELFLENNFIDEHWDVLNWNKRQFISDDVTQRVQRHRDKTRTKHQKRNVTETLLKRECNGNVTPPDTDTDTDTEIPLTDKLCDSPSHDANGTEFYLTHRKRKLAGKRLETFNQFWEAFAYKKSRAAAADAWMDIPQLTMSLVTTIIEAAQRTASERPDLIAQGHTPKMAQGWITERRWEDEGMIVPKSAWELRCEQEAELEAN